MIELRPVVATDAEALFPLIFQSIVTDTLLWDGPDSLEEFRQGLAEREERTSKGESHSFTILEVFSGNPIGSASIRPDENNFRATVGLWIGEPYHGKGYGTQTVRKLLDYGFVRLNLEKIDADVHVGNWASRRIFEKNGFQLEGTIRKAVLKRGNAVDEWFLGIIHAEWEQEAGSMRASIAHIGQRKRWEAIKDQDEYLTDSLEHEGFIHCSRTEQVLQVANRYYQDVPEIVVLWIDPELVKAEIRWEAADADIFPHIYGPLNLEAVVAVHDLVPDADGVYRNLPRE